MILGLTGGIASGKSSVSNIFAKLGAEIIDADLIARDIVNDKAVLAEICKEFGVEAVKDNCLDRKYIADIIFSNLEKREKLNQIVHPAVISKIRIEIKKAEKEKVILVDVPLLYEVQLEKEMDKVVVVYIDKNIQIDRLMKRDNITRKKALDRINSQMSLEKKAEKADIIIDNSGRMEELKNKVFKLYSELS